jgi:hypothetical protein
MAAPLDEIADFLATASPEKVMAFKLSDSTQQRIRELIKKEKEGKIQSDEADELDRYLLLDNLMMIAKARAHVRLSQTP